MAKKKTEEIKPVTFQKTAGIPMYQKAPTDLAVPNEFKIGNQLLNKATLIAQRDKDVQLIINGIEDKAGYDTAIIKRRDYRTVRTTIEKVRKDLSAPHQAYVKKLKEVTDEIGAEAYKGEEYFNDMIVAVDNEKARIKAEAEEKALSIMHNRIQVLLGLDAKFDGSTYTFDYADEYQTTSVELKEMSDEGFEDFVHYLKEGYDAQQAKIEQERLEAEQEAERVKQQAEANETERKKLLEQRTAMRIKELTKLYGFELKEGDLFYSHPIMPNVVQVSVLNELADDRWETMMASFEKDVENHINQIKPTTRVVEDIEMDVLGANTDLDEAVASEIKTVETILTWNDINPYFDIIVSPKRTVRIGPVEVKVIDDGGCGLVPTGNYQGLHWAIIKT